VSNAATSTDRRKYLTAGVAGGFALVFAIVAYVATGPTLGLFFGGLVIVALLVPPMVLCERSMVRQGLVASAVNDAVGLVWLVAVFRTQTTLWQWLQCYLVLAAFAFALWGCARAIRAARLPMVPSGALTVTLAMLWLTWPIWLSRALTSRMVEWLAPAHPPLAINGVLAQLGVWSEHAIAYRHLLSLGQDVAYQLPASILAAVFAHVIAGGILFALASLRAGPTGAREDEAPAGP
jgi:hypothetical protein